MSFSIVVTAQAQLDPFDGNTLKRQWTIHDTGKPDILRVEDGWLSMKVAIQQHQSGVAPGQVSAIPFADTNPPVVPNHVERDR